MPKFRPAQPAWLRKRDRAGGRCYVLLQVGQGADASRYLLYGIYAPKMAEGLTEDALRKLSITDHKATAVEIIEAAALRD